MPRTCILICTFERPQLLHKLLAALVDQVRGQACTVIVVDNGTSSSEDIVLAFAASMNIVYDRLSARGLVSARNRALTLGVARRPRPFPFSRSGTPVLAANDGRRRTRPQVRAPCPAIALFSQREAGTSG